VYSPQAGYNLAWPCDPCNQPGDSQDLVRCRLTKAILLLLSSVETLWCLDLQNKVKMALHKATQQLNRQTMKDQTVMMITSQDPAQNQGGLCLLLLSGLPHFPLLCITL